MHVANASSYQSQNAMDQPDVSAAVMRRILKRGKSDGKQIITADRWLRIELTLSVPERTQTVSPKLTSTNSNAPRSLACRRLCAPPCPTNCLSFCVLNIWLGAVTTYISICWVNSTKPEIERTTWRRAMWYFDDCGEVGEDRWVGGLSFDMTWLWFIYKQFLCCRAFVLLCGCLDSIFFSDV